MGIQRRFDKIVLAISMRGTMYAGVPLLGQGYRIRRFRPGAPEGQRDAVLEGMMAAVEGMSAVEPCQAERLVSCDGRRFRIVPGCFGMPVLGKNMIVGRVDNRHEVSSPVHWLRLMVPARAGFLDAIFEAYRNSDPSWLDFVDQATRRLNEKAA